MRARILLVCMAVICSLSPVGYSQADQKEYRALALELAEMAYPEETMVATAMGGVKLAVEGAFERDPIARPYGAVLGKAMLETLEAVIRDPETIKRLRDMQADIFMETYTESELREIMNFYRTPIGKKTIQSSPDVARKGMERGMAIGRSLAETPKFREMLKDKIERFIAEEKLPETP